MRCTEENFLWGCGPWTSRREFLAFLWYKSPVPVFLERFILTVCAALAVAVLATNPFKFDWWQRGALALCIASFALFISATLSRAKSETRQPPTDINQGTRLAITLTPTGTQGKNVPVTGAAIVLQNLSDVLDRHVYVTFASPSPITSVTVDSPERVRVISGGPSAIGPGGNRMLELSVPELFPHESRIIRVETMKVTSGDFRAGLSSELCGKDCKNVVIVRPVMGSGETKP
jgi:hypothetical protein